MKKILLPIFAAMLLCGCTGDYEETNEIDQYSEWDFTCMGYPPQGFEATERDCEIIAPMAELIFENWEMFHNWQMPEVFIENYFSSPGFWDYWNIITWSKEQDAFGDTIGDQDYWIEWWDEYGKIYWNE